MNEKVKMVYSILAGILISLGCIINLQIGGIAGALLFPLGLITILMFIFLFTFSVDLFW